MANVVGKLVTYQWVEQINKYTEDKGARFLTIREERKDTRMKRWKASMDHAILDCHWRNQCRLLMVSSRDR